MGEVPNIVNSTADQVILHVLHGAQNYADIKRSLLNLNLSARERGQRLVPILTAVKQAVNDRGPSDESCDSLALYFVQQLEEAQSRAAIPGASLEAVKQNVKIVDAAVGPLITETVDKAFANQRWRLFLHAVCFFVLSGLTFYLLAKTADTWKEICAAFMPQVFTVMFHVVEYAFKAETAGLDDKMKAILVLSRGTHLVSRLLDEMTTV